jgi:hypothetical protein
MRSILDPRHNPLLVDPMRAQQLSRLCEMRRELDRIQDGATNVSSAYYDAIEKAVKSLDKSIESLCGALVYAAQEGKQ